MGTKLSYNGIIKKFGEFVYFTNVKNVEVNEFYNCYAIEKIHLPSSVTAIYQRAFRGNNALQDLQLNEGLTTLAGSEIFGYTYALKILTFPSTLINFTKYGRGDIFSNCYIETIDIPEGTSSLPDGIFYPTTKSSTIILPSTITTLGTNAFRSCYAPTIVVKAVEPPTLGTDSWLYNRAEVIYVPDSSVDAYKSANVWSEKASIIKPMSEYEG